jgi:5'(3')-deoxyribonucleotidase
MNSKGIPPYKQDRLIAVCDIDGVLADFVNPYRRLCSALVGKDLQWGVAGEPSHWMFAVEEWKLPEVVVDQSWRIIHSEPNWWLNLPVLDMQAATTVHLLQEEVDFYFVTARRGPNVKWQTEQWLRINLNIINPTVIISPEKAAMTEVVGAHLIIEDRPENLEDVPNGVKRFLVKHAYNLWAQDVEEYLTVDSATEAFTYMEKEGLWLPRR